MTKKGAYSMVVGKYFNMFEKKGKLTAKRERKLIEWFENFDKS